ncbi:MAG: UbiA prenyltransferase family protein [Planctomycetota bacterium]
MIRALILALRPKHWVKNLVVFIGLVYGLRLPDAAALWRVFLAFCAFCAAASAVYLINDIADVQEDRLHPRKRHRPIASGALPPSLALLAGVLLAAAALALGTYLSFGEGATAVLHQIRQQPPPAFAPPTDALSSPRSFVAILAVYLVMNTAYSVRLKRVVIADVILVALGFLLRVIAGTAVIGLPVSSWLILCTFYLATLLALTKRRGEIAMTKEAGGGRSVLREYDSHLLDLLIGLSAAAAILTYSIYTSAPETVAKFHTRNLLFTIPLVVYGVGRYLYLIYHQGKGDDPVALLFQDPHLWLILAAWIAASALILYRGPISV